MVLERLPASSSTATPSSRHSAWQESLAKEKRVLTSQYVKSRRACSEESCRGKPIAVDDRQRDSATFPCKRVQRLPGRRGPQRARLRDSATKLPGIPECSARLPQSKQSHVDLGDDPLRPRTGKSMQSERSGSTAPLKFYNDGQILDEPRLRSSASWSSSTSMQALRKEVEDAVQEELAKTLMPLKERLEAEKSRRERAEQLLSQARSGIC
mmetsp:Transcript_31403/g.57687  ORF Transcript_31403/g.57687 Transcript_31403/m.57687 type:complete len:211 (+) Transcript_31403:86-718(+)